MNKKLSSFVMFLLISTSLCFAVLSRNDAENLLLSSIVHDRIGQVDVYLYDELMPLNENVACAGYSVLTPYNSNWVAFIDEAPAFGWAHPCTYVFINSETGQYQLHQDQRPIRNLSDFDKISSINYIANNDIPVPPGDQTTNRPSNEHIYAVLINAVTSTSGGAPTYLRFWNELSAMFTTLVYEYGCPRDHIKVLSTDATDANNFAFSHAGITYRGRDLDFRRESQIPSIDIQYRCNISNLTTVFSSLGSEVESDDVVMVFITGHGEYDNDDGFNFRTWDNEWVYSSTLNSLLDNLNNCKQVSIVATGCHSGGLINGVNSITGHNRTIITSCDANESEPAELWHTPVNSDPASGYGEFAYYFISALRGRYPVKENIDPENYPVMLNQPWADGLQVGIYDFPGFPGYPNNPTHPEDIPYWYLNENYNISGDPLLFRAYQYADIWDTISDQELMEEGLTQWANYLRVHQQIGNPSYRSHPQYYSNGCLYRDRQTIADVNLNLAGYNVWDQVTFDNRTLTLNGNLYVSGCLKLINNSVFNIPSGSTLNLQGGKYQTINSSSNITGIISMTDAGLVSIEDNSTLTCNAGSGISGSTNVTWIDPYTGFRYDTLAEAQSHNPNVGAEHMAPGDRVVIDHSSLYAIGNSTNHVNIYSNNNNKWDGLYLIGEEGYPSECSFLFSYCDITKVSNIDIQYTQGGLQHTDINNIGQLKVQNESDVSYSYLSYHNNDNGIYIDRSQFHRVSYPYNQISDIHDNMNGGISFNHIGPGNILVDMNIYNNAGNGVEILNCFVIMDDCNIWGNSEYGYQSLSQITNYIYTSNINNNGRAEVISLRRSFPNFNPHNSATVHSNINDDYISLSSGDQYLLMAVGQPNWDPDNPGIPLPVNGIGIQTYGDLGTRLVPELDQWVFTNPGGYDQAELMYNNAMQSIYLSEYIAAIDSLKSIISLYSESDYAKKAISLLPYLYKTINGDMDALQVYYDSLQDESLDFSKLKAEIAIDISEKTFIEAISKLETIINTPPDNTEQLLAEIDEAYCYFMLVSGESKAFPAQCTHRPQNFAEYSAIRDMIFDQIINDGDDNSDNNSMPIIRIDAKNYPNPFNPNTIISYTLPKETQCRIDVYNLKGQKVKTLANSNLSEGKHSVMWNGLDDSGKQVSSGVYFYKLVTPDKSITKKMIMMK